MFESSGGRTIHATAPGSLRAVHASDGDISLTLPTQNLHLISPETQCVLGMEITRSQAATTTYTIAAESDLSIDNAIQLTGLKNDNTESITARSRAPSPKPKLIFCTYTTLEIESGTLGLGYAASIEAHGAVDGLGNDTYSDEI